MDITDKTSISLFAVLVSAPVLVGGIVWLTNIDAKASRALAETTKQEEILQQTHDAVIRIEEQMRKIRK